MRGVDVGLDLLRNVFARERIYRNLVARKEVARFDAVLREVGEPRGIESRKRVVRVALCDVDFRFRQFERKLGVRRLLPFEAEVDDVGIAIARCRESQILDFVGIVFCEFFRGLERVAARFRFD